MSYIVIILLYFIASKNLFVILKQKKRGPFATLELINKCFLFEIN